MVVSAGDAWLDQNFSRQQATLAQIRSTFQLPVAPGSTYPHKTAELWLARGSVTANLSTMPELQPSVDLGRDALSTRRGWHVTHGPLHRMLMRRRPNLPSPERYRAIAELDRDLLLVWKLHSGLTADGERRPLQLRILPDGTTPWSEITTLILRSREAQLVSLALTFRTPGGAPSDHMLERRCDELPDLNLERDEVWLSYTMRSNPSQHQPCSGSDCVDAARELLQVAGVGGSLCISPTANTTSEQLAAILRLTHELGIEPVLTY